jgi:NTP pyrophosphatase (non-canonical NTP hydrolase)
MEFSELIKEQITRDRRRGFDVDFESDAAREEQLTRDLVGLFGEIGEFSNLLKKVMLTRSVEGYAGPTLSSAAPELGEELADAAIYLFRLSTILGRNLEEDVITKMKKNDERYGSLEK